MLLRQALTEVLVARAGFNVVGQAGNGHDAVALAESLTPDIVLMAASMPELNGIEATRQVTRRLPQVRVIVISGALSRHAVVEAFRAGANGYLLRHSEIDELILAVNIVFRGNTFVASEIANTFDVAELIWEARNPGAERGDGPLSEREREVMQLLAEGKTAREVAERLGISIRTVDGHRERIMRKAGVHNRFDLYRWAVRHGVVAGPEAGA